MKSKLSAGILVPVLTAAVMLVLLLALNPGGLADAPFSGDNGLKMWQAASLPQSGTTLVRPVPEGIAASDYAPALTSPSGDGLRGDYGTVFARFVRLPSMGSTLAMRMVVLVLTLLSLPLLYRLADGSVRGTAAFVMAGLVPYSLVFWEHGPAVTLFLLGTLLLMKQLENGSRSPWWIPAFALSCIWRPENAVCLVGLFAAVAVSGKGFPGRRNVMTAAGISLAVATVTVLVTGPSLLPLHLRNNLPLFGAGWVRSRLDVLGSWSVPLSNLPAAAGLVLAVSGGAVILLRHRLGITNRLLRAVRVFGLAGCAVAGYYFLRGSLGNMSLLSLSPGLLLLPYLPLNRFDRRSRILVSGAVAGGLLVFLASPTDGMFQFGARFLLVPATLAAVGLLRAAEDPFPGSPGRALLPLALAGATLLGTARAVVFQESFRRWHHGISESMASLPEGMVAATDQPWLPLVAWRVTMSRPVLCIRDVEKADSLAESDMELVWISPEELPGWTAGEPGYRDLRLGVLGEGLSIPVIPGPAVPAPPSLSI